LPCDDSICREHLTERDVLKQNKIKCNEFKSIVAFNQFIERQSYLGDVEISLKQQLEMSIRNFFQFYDDFVQFREKWIRTFLTYFQEMRSQIDDEHIE